MPSLLLEIGCEELPASACKEAEGQFPDLCRRHLGRPPERLFIGPRRLGFLVTELPERTPDEWVKGPPLELRDRAAEGFARRHGVAVGELTERDGFLGVEVSGRPLAEVLPEKLENVVRGLAFGKSMRWGTDLRFARPVRWLLAKLDGKTVAFEAGGLVASDASAGHRFSEGPVTVRHADDYTDALRGAGVEPDAEVREQTIRDGLDALGEWRDRAGVLAEVVHLVESPLVLEGRFDERFLELPEQVVVTAMQSHQRYFPLGGNRFALVANGGEPDVVRAGNERVLEGRLDDAAFTFERDVKVGIDALTERLGSITFFAEAGSFADKTERLLRLVEELGGGEASREAARLAKADQAAELVREFPELEGYVGAEYARLAGYPDAVSAAIEEQYLPDAASGPLPETEAGKVLAAADKIDNLLVSFRLGKRPSGSRDPFGLRRAAIGLCRLAIEGGLELDRRRHLPDDEVREFVEERLESMLDVPVEFVRAARRSGVRDLGGVAALARFLAALDDAELEPVHTVYTRASRIVDGTEDGKLNPSLLVEEAEVELARAVEAEEVRIAREVEGRNFARAFEAAAGLAPAVERFFDEVLVMAEDHAVRANRLRLLADVRDAVGALGDFSQIPR